MVDVTPADIADHVAPIEPQPVADAPAPPAGGTATAAAPRRTRRKPRPGHIASGVPVVAFTGVNGAGKTLLAVDCALHDLANGRPVYSTVQINSPWGNSEPIRSLRQLLEIEDATILLDEVAVILGSRGSGAQLPSEFQVLLQTLRHKRLRVMWTAPQWMRAHNQLRLATQGLVNVTPLARRRSADDPWGTPGLVMAGLMDTSVGAADEMPTKVLRRRFYLPKRLHGWGAYDTHADTPFLGIRSRGGTCHDCGGQRPPVKHSKELHEALGVPWYDDL